MSRQMEDDVRHLQDDLRQAREELARARQQLEALAEDDAQHRRELESLTEAAARHQEEVYSVNTRRWRAEDRLRALSTAVSDHLSALDLTPSPRTGLVDKLTGRRNETPGDDDDLLLIKQSPLFQGPWYVRRYPDAVTSGLSPARHYLEVGAAMGYDPGPKFSTADYLAAHPRVKRSGVNPLLHHLRKQRGKTSRKQRQSG